MNIDKLDEIVVKCNNTCNRTIKMRPVDFKLCAYIEYGVEHNDEDLKFEIGDHLNISKCKNIFTRGCTPNWSEEVYVIKKVKKKTTVPWKYVLSYLNDEKKCWKIL